MPEETEDSAVETPRRGRSARPPGRRPLKEGDSDDTRRTIRRQAIRLFNEYGYASVSMDDIAAAAGLTRATLYYHYRGKAEIFAEAVVVILGFVQEEVQRVLSQHDLSVRERLIQYVAGRRVGSLSEFDRTTEAALSETMVWATLPHLAPRQRARVTEKLNLLHKATRAVFAEGVESGELRPLPVSVLDYAFWQLFDPDSYPEPLEMPREQWEEHLMTVFLGYSASSYV